MAAPVKLSMLRAFFVRYESSEEDVEVVDGDHETWRERGCPTRVERRVVHRWREVPGLAEAQGVVFLCPLCFQTNGGEVGTHVVDVSFEGRGVLPEQGTHGRDRQPTRWTVAGTGLDDLTLAPSVHLDGPGCGWHGFVQNGSAA